MQYMAEKAILHTSPPITIRWDSRKKPVRGLRIKFPRVTEDGGMDFDTPFDELTKDFAGWPNPGCHTASMDASDFSTDFDPYGLGIVDTIAQVLLPEVATNHGGVRAELQGLKVLCGPSGAFRISAEAPQLDGYGNPQFGWLVVALPCKFSGGKIQ